MSLYIVLQSYVGNVECGRLYVAVTSVNVTCANSASRRLVLTPYHTACVQKYVHEFYVYSLGLCCYRFPENVLYWSLLCSVR